MKSGIYQIRNVLNSHAYVGSAVNLSRRWGEHKSELNRVVHCNDHLQHAWNKYGTAAFVFELLEYTEPQRLIRQEQYWMDKLDVIKNGYNMRPMAGSQLGMKRSAETRAKISVVARNRTFSTVTRAKMSASQKGRKFSAETRAKISAALRGRKFSSEHRRKIAIAGKGRAISSETKAKMSASRKGRVVSAETRAKISKALKKRGVNG